MTVIDRHEAETLIELDARKRVSLPMGKPGRYLVEVTPDGTIILTPAVVLTKMELAILNSPGIMASIDRAEAAGHTGGRKDRPKWPLGK